MADGDTMSVLDRNNTQHKIRMGGIDAAEKRQAFGYVSKQSLADEAAGQSVTVKWKRLDRYGRKVGKVFKAGTDANLKQIKRGLAWHYKDYEREQSVSDRKMYSAAEVAARENKRGLWRDVEPIRPSEWRRANRPTQVR